MTLLYVVREKFLQGNTNRASLTTLIRMGVAADDHKDKTPGEASPEVEYAGGLYSQATRDEGTAQLSGGAGRVRLVPG